MATERQAPDAILASSGLSGAVTDIDDDPDSPDANWLTNTASDPSVRVSFPTPTGSPNTGADLQEFRVQVRKDASGGGDPTAAIELWEGDSLVATVLAATTVTTLTGVVLSGTWDASSLATADGSAVECRVVGAKGGGGPNERNIEVGAVEWNVDYSAAQTVAIGQAAETDTAQALGKAKQTTIGQATETALAQALGRVKLVPVGQALETSTAQALARLKSALVGQAIETDTAQAVGGGTSGNEGGDPRIRVVGSGGRVRRSLHMVESPSGPQTVVVGQAIEADTAQVLGRLKEKAIGQALETATAQAVTRVKARTIGQATETALAQALGRVKEKLIGQAAETDTAQAVSAAGKQVIAVGQAVETDIAQALAFAKAKAIGLATETDTAQALTVVRPVLIGQALETNTAQPVDYFKTVRLGQAVETDTALTVTVVGGLVVVHGAPGPLRVEVDPYSTEIDLDPSLTAVDLDPSITHVAVDRDRTTT